MARVGNIESNGGNYMFNYKLWCLEGGIIGFIAVTAIVMNGNADYFDAYYGGVIQSIRADWLTTLVELITYLGNWQAIIIICILLLAFEKTRKTYGIPIAIVAIISSVLNRVAKLIIQRPRPDVADMLIQESGYSYPSGHTATAIAVFILLAYIICKNTDSKKKAIIYATLLVVLAFAISLSRIYLGVHYASDVLGGAFVGMTCLSGVALYFYPPKKEKEKWKEKMRAKEKAKQDRLDTVEADIVEESDMLKDVQERYDEEDNK